MLIIPFIAKGAVKKNIDLVYLFFKMKVARACLFVQTSMETESTEGKRYPHIEKKD